VERVGKLERKGGERGVPKDRPGKKDAGKKKSPRHLTFFEGSKGGGKRLYKKEHWGILAAPFNFPPTKRAKGRVGGNLKVSVKKTKGNANRRRREGESEKLIQDRMTTPLRKMGDTHAPCARKGGGKAPSILRGTTTPITKTALP